MKARINGTLMPVIFNGNNIVIALDPNKPEADQRTTFSKFENTIVLTESAKLTKNKRRRIQTRRVFNH